MSSKFAFETFDITAFCIGMMKRSNSESRVLDVSGCKGRRDEGANSGLSVYMIFAFSDILVYCSEGFGSGSLGNYFAKEASPIYSLLD